MILIGFLISFLGKFNITINIYLAGHILVGKICFNVHKCVKLLFNIPFR